MHEPASGTRWDRRDLETRPNPFENHLVECGGITETPSSIQNLQTNQLPGGVELSGDPFGEFACRDCGFAENDTQGINFGVVTDEHGGTSQILTHSPDSRPLPAPSGR
jgi:hypothetical protein